LSEKEGRKEGREREREGRTKMQIGAELSSLLPAAGLIADF
jgi:hypothetical protein